MPRVSVLMSVYNSEKFIAQAIESILRQTFNDFEFLIVDDGSRDSSTDIIAGYRDSRIRFSINASNIGLTASLNKELKLARGEYVARMDADDISEPERFQRQIDFLDSHKDIGLVGTSRIVIDENGREIIRISALCDPEEIRNKLWQDNQFCHGSVMFRKICLNKVGPYRETLKYSQDYDLWFRISEICKIANIGSFLYKLRISGNAITAAHRFEQEQYAALVRMLAMERRKIGRDNLPRYEKEGIKNVLCGLIADTTFNRNRVSWLYYYRMAIILFYAGASRQAWAWFCRARRTGMMHRDNFYFGLKILMCMWMGQRLFLKLKEMQLQLKSLLTRGQGPVRRT